MAETKDLVRIRASEIVVGQPLPWSAYDANGRLLLSRGQVVQSLNQVHGLLQRGLFREVFGRERGPAPEVVADETRVKAAELTPFEDLKLAPGEVVQLQPLAAGAKETYKVRLVGYSKGHSILISVPEAGGKLLPISDGQIFNVRVFSGLVIGSFTAKVLKVLFAPYPYLHLSYPNGVQTMRLRKAMRAAVELEATVYDKEGGSPLATGLINDISVGGARLLLGKAVGDKERTLVVGFKAHVGEIEESVQVTAVVRSVVADTGPDGQPRNVYGLQFENLNQHQQLFLMNLVYKLIYKDTI
ncbi:c-di-GMP-binding flagellar brake protein YcgR [Sulfuritortus calidifontis]|uniref:C-di-GMP-binding flagellar brake protein YcgR n=1 Tax=Sulfuritortus calidifontis TaxID=1914471 RepID=A0A4R3JYR8_9PROT|nr:flagellar brake protein [Sulfuritortus calidifontis]TCS73895.1 c-di-GMP-binding flagellar brake protein YcgR [Sulfuritortus calidifontis]